MNIKTKSCKILLASLVAMSFSIGYIPNAYAEIVNIKETASYNMGDSETPSVATSRAIELARRQAGEKVAVYIESYSKSINNVLTEDVIKVTSASIMKDRVTPETRRSLDPDGSMNITATIDVIIDTDQIKGMLNRVIQDSKYKENYISVFKKNKQLEQELLGLKQALKQAQEQNTKIALESKIINNERQYTANEYFRKGFQAENNKNSNKAIEYYTKSISLNPNDGKAYNNRGVAYSNLKRYNEAISNYNKSIAMMPQNAEAYNNRGVAYSNLKRYNEAISDFNKAIALDPMDADIYYNRGDAYSELNRYNEALADFNKAIKINPNDADHYYIRGCLYGNFERYNEALADFNKAIKLNPNKDSFYYDRGKVYNEFKRYYDAIADFSKAIALNPSDAGAYNALAYSYMYLKNYNMAIQTVNKAITLSPNDSSYYDSRGEIYEAMGMYNESLKDYNKALSMNHSKELNDEILSHKNRLLRKLN